MRFVLFVVRVFGFVQWLAAVAIAALIVGVQIQALEEIEGGGVAEALAELGDSLDAFGGVRRCRDARHYCRERSSGARLVGCDDTGIAAVDFTDAIRALLPAGSGFWLTAAPCGATKSPSSGR